tara:strand:+ start:180 stop:350 length:171 start_codon:yes stop_codon:yes gene_type:complete
MRKYILYISIFTVSAFVGYGIKTVYNGDSLDREYWLIAIILICSQVPFYFSESKGK